MKNEENQKMSLAMKAITFLVLLKQILYKNQPNSRSDEWETEEEEDWEKIEDDEKEETEERDPEEEDFNVILNEAIAKQLPEELEGNLELAELIRHTFYESLEKKEAENEAGHVSDV